MSDIAKCCVCNTELFDWDNQDEVHDMESNPCNICGDMSCDDCTIEIEEETYDEIVKILPNMDGSVDDADQSCCISCLADKEKEMIQALPPEKLPLLINFMWNTEEGTLAYKAALARTETLA